MAVREALSFATSGSETSSFVVHRDTGSTTMAATSGCGSGRRDENGDTSMLRHGMAKRVAALAAGLAFACTADSGLSFEPQVRAPQFSASDPSRPAEDALTVTHAAARRARVDNVHYELFFDISENATSFFGKATIRFDLTPTPTSQPLTLDFGGGTLESVVLNGVSDGAVYNGWFLTLPDELLRTGNNEITLQFRHGYGRDGNGLHRFSDPEDGRTYLYTYLWPYYANRLFPAFDQPNLKATFDLAVRAPRAWTVVSMAAGQVTASDTSTSTWTFETTPRISTYVFSLHAGPYRVWEQRAGDIPIRLFARQSLARHVAVEEWFDVTRTGLAFYGDYFDIPYPFGKYDQLIVPDFPIGAMENVAAVTFAERFVQRKPSDRFERESRAGIILHEMAHMWFGNLVTKDWWNGLWLNESFATLMAHIALVEATEFSDAWHEFFVDNKQRAYFKDSRVTTHPIEVPVHSTADFFSVFDAITYQKGSSVLKQMAHFVGEESFRKGVSAYLEKHAFGNTDLTDFIASQSRASGRDLTSWARQWLYEPGFNGLHARVTCNDGVITQMVIEQTATARHPQLRRHRVDVAIYNLDSSGRLVAGPVFDSEIDGPQSVVAQGLGGPCPALVFPNHNDWGFARVLQDDESVQTIKAHIQSLDDPLSRSMFWQSLFDRAMEAKMSLEEYVVLAAEGAATEAHLRVLAHLIQSLESSVRTLERLAPESDRVLDRIGPTLESLSWERAQEETDGDKVRLWFDLFVAVSNSDESLSRMGRLLSGEASIPKLPMSQDLRWDLLAALSAKGAGDISTLIAEEEKRDGSDKGRKKAIAAQAVQPDTAVKSRWFEELLNPDSPLGLARQRSAMASLYPSNQTELQLRNLQEILDALPMLSKTRDPYFLSSFTADLLRPMGREESVAAMTRALDDSDALNSTTLRFLREALQADREYLALRRRLRD
jgi:aminopeptidase N